MATTTSFANSFKAELMKGQHNLDAGGNALKMALIKVAPAGTYGPASTNYSQLLAAGDEVVGAGYVAGGAALTNTGVSVAAAKGIADFGNASWPGATFNATAVELYNVTSAGKTIAFWDFGGTQSIVGSTFSIVMPPSGAATSIIRIA